MKRARPAPSQARLRARRRGLRAETAAAMWLMCKGYRIVARGWRTRLGEIDLVVRRGHVLVFVEVKARAALADAAEAVTPRKRRRVVQAARDFLARNPAHAGCDLRFDAVLVRPWQLPVHIADAWPAEGA